MFVRSYCVITKYIWHSFEVFVNVVTGLQRLSPRDES